MNARDGSVIKWHDDDDGDDSTTLYKWRVVTTSAVAHPDNFILHRRISHPVLQTRI